MAAPSITAFPEKIINTFLSKWNASSLPIQYTINNDKFPVGETVTNYFTQVLIFINGSLVATIKQIPDSNNNTKVDVRKYAQTALKLVQSSGVRDTNASCNIYITGSEEYIDAASVSQSNAITGGGPSVLHFATLSALPFGGSRGGNMYDYIIDRNKADLGKFMTFFIRGQLVDSTAFLLSFILQEPGYDIEVKQFDINAGLLVTELITIPDEGIGVYRIDLAGANFDADNISYLTVEILTDTYGTAVSEIFNIDVDLDCAVAPLAPSNLIAVAGGDPSTEVDLSWSSNSDGEETGFGVERGTDGILFVPIGTTETGVVTFEDTGLAAGAQFFYRVRALGGLPSAYSNTANIFTLDADASLFITNAVITVQTQKDAINVFVITVKVIGVWTKSIIIYLFVGGSASQHKFNLKDPQDTDAAHRALFSGGLTHNPTGVKPGGINGKADTFLNCDSDLPCQDAFYCIYLRDTVEPDPVTFAFGAFNNPAFMGMQPDDGGPGPPSQTSYAMGSTTAANFILKTNGAADQVGVHVQSRRSSTDFEVRKDKVIVDVINTNSETNPGPTNDTTLWARGSALFNNNQTSLYACGTSLTTQEMDDLTDAVTTFRTAIDP